MPLSSQELRKALHGGKLLDYIDEFIRNSAPHKDIFGEGLDKRMRDVELVLRFVTFERFFNNYKGNLKRFLDEAVVFYNENWDAQKTALDQELNKYNIAMTTAKGVFGTDVFKKWNGSTYERRINRAVFDVIARYFSEQSFSELAVANKERIVQSFNLLCESNDSFRDSIERTTKTPLATNTRYRLWGEELGLILGRRLDLDTMRLV